MISWTDGINGYKTHTICEHEHFIEYVLKIAGNLPKKNFIETFSDIFVEINQPINVMYSGGIDSEFVLLLLCSIGKKVTAYTMNLVYNNMIINTQDVYYSDKFCRHNNINHKFISLDVNQFYESGNYLQYINQYNIKSAYLSSQYWLLEQVDGFNIIGGNYFWPKFEHPLPVLSPMTYGSNFHQLFMNDNRILGIGNMLSHSYELNYLLIQEHKKYVNKLDKVDPKIVKFKVYNSLLDKKLELRNISHGWENQNIFDITKYDLPKTKMQLTKIVWDDHIKQLLETNKNENYLR